jgi:hypothetical protein
MGTLQDEVLEFRGDPATYRVSRVAPHDTYAAAVCLAEGVAPKVRCRNRNRAVTPANFKTCGTTLTAAPASRDHRAS